MDKQTCLIFLRKYLNTYVESLYKIPLTVSNMEEIFSYQGNERHEYPLYFIWVLPEFRQWYISNDALGYMILGKNFTYHMKDLLMYNSYVLDTVYELMTLPRPVRTHELISCKISLGPKIHHTMEGCQKFIWSFIARVEKMKSELSISSS